MTFTPILALVPVLSTPADLPRTAAGLFTIGYTLRDCYPDHLRRAVGRDRQTMDGLRAAVHLRRTLTVLGAIGHPLAAGGHERRPTASTKQIR